MAIEDVTENIVGLTDICFICWHLLYLISVIRSTVFFLYITQLHSNHAPVATEQWLFY